MCQPQVLLDTERWNGGMGLGFFVHRAPSGRTWVGHDGGMPGHLTSLLTHRESGTGGIVLMSNTAGPDPSALAIQLAEKVVDDVPVEDEPWRPGTAVPEELAGIIGRWYSEGRGFTFSVREGRLEARQDGAPATRPPSVFTAEAPDRYRTESGRERGELLRVTRDESGAVDRLHWATYLFMREPLGFGEHSRRGSHSRPSRASHPRDARQGAGAKPLLAIYERRQRRRAPVGRRAAGTELSTPRR